VRGGWGGDACGANQSRVNEYKPKRRNKHKPKCVNKCTRHEQAAGQRMSNGAQQLRRCLHNSSDAAGPARLCDAQPAACSAQSGRAGT